MTITKVASSVKGRLAVDFHCKSEIPNAIRRIVLSEIPNISVPVILDKENPHFVIDHNDSDLDNQKIMHRIALIPHMFSGEAIDNWVEGACTVTLDVVNTGKYVRFVRSNELVMRMSGPYSSEQPFRADPITGGYSIITTLPPGGRLRLSYIPNMGIHMTHAAYGVHKHVSFKSYEDEMKDGESTHFRMEIETICGMSNEELLVRALRILSNKVISLKPLTIQPNGEIHIDGESVTVGSPVQAWLFDAIVEKRLKHICAAGRKQDHPLHKVLILTFGINKGSTIDEATAEFRDEVTKLTGYIDKMVDSFVTAVNINVPVGRTNKEAEAGGIIVSTTEQAAAILAGGVPPTGVPPTPPTGGSPIRRSSMGGSPHGSPIKPPPLAVVAENHGVTTQRVLEEELIRAVEYKKLHDDVARNLLHNFGFKQETERRELRKLSYASDLLQRCMLTQTWFRDETTIDPLFVHTPNNWLKEEIKRDIETFYRKAYRSNHIVDRFRGRPTAALTSAELSAKSEAFYHAFLSMVEQRAINAKAQISQLTFTPKSLLILPVQKKRGEDKVINYHRIEWTSGNENIPTGYSNHGFNSKTISLDYYPEMSILKRDLWSGVSAYFRMIYMQITSQALQKDRDPEEGIDGFSTPFNTYNQYFCSGYPDVDGPLGSLGTYLDFCKKVIEGPVAIPVRHLSVNPPYVEVVLNATMGPLEDLLAATKARGEKWTGSLIFPNWPTLDAIDHAKALHEKAASLGYRTSWRISDNEIAFRSAFEGTSTNNIGTPIFEMRFQNFV